MTTVVDKTIGIIGIGAFGAFILPHLVPHFREIRVFDSLADVSGRLAALALPPSVQERELQDVASADLVLFCVPLQAMRVVARQIAPWLRDGQLVLDVCSVKLAPTRILLEELPGGVEIIGLHPLFGPQSGKNGISGLGIALCDVRSRTLPCVRAFLQEKLGLRVIEASPEEHDREMASVQGLTHLIGKVFSAVELPSVRMKTKSYTLLHEMAEMIRYDSDELFQAIQKDNPYAQAVKDSFFAAARHLEGKLSEEKK